MAVPMQRTRLISWMKYLAAQSYLSRDVANFYQVTVPAIIVVQ